MPNISKAPDKLLRYGRYNRQQKAIRTLRQHNIIKMVRKDPTLTTAELAVILKVSKKTIYRDLELLGDMAPDRGHCLVCGQDLPKGMTLKELRKVAKQKNLNAAQSRRRRREFSEGLAIGKGRSHNGGRKEG